MRPETPRGRRRISTRRPNRPARKANEPTRRNPGRLDVYYPEHWVVSMGLQRMTGKVQILHSEGDRDFAELVRSLFAQDGLDVELKCVGDRAAFQAALDAGAFDVIISDYHLPSFSGLDALAMVRKKNPHIPFILVSGTIGEQAAIESLKAGATDYLLKQQIGRAS